MRCILAAGLFAVLFVTCTTSAPATDSSSKTAANRGSELYAVHCAACHGVNGDADTPIARLLQPRPTTFRSGVFKLVSTTNGVPTTEDLVRTLRHGMPGSTMMSFRHLPEGDLLLLATEVQRLAVQGRAQSIAEAAKIGGQTPSREQLLAMAETQLRPGATVAAVEPIEPTDSARKQGRTLFERHCASCHGQDGGGLPGLREWPTDGTWLWPRDLTQGYLRGGADWRALSHRILAGMPGAHMPPTRLSPEETAALIIYLQELIPDAARHQHVQWQRTVRVPRVATLPADDDAEALRAIEAVRLPLAALWWRNDACDEAQLRVAHDGETVLWHMSWRDLTRDNRPHPQRAMGDGAAVQFAASETPPLFAMGSKKQPVNVWRWHAYDPKEMAGGVDLLNSATHQGLDVAPVATAPKPRSESLLLHGARSAPGATTSGLPLHAQPKWHDGTWTLTFRRPLRARGDREVDLTGRETIRFAIAVWDGSIDQHAGSKAITNWHVLELE